MDKSVLISIQPKWCKLIANGRKTVEVRKTKPKIETPFRCFIYCSKDVVDFWISTEKENPVNICTAKAKDCYRANGKVIGEFMCDNISTYEAEFYPEEMQPIFEAIYEYNEEEDVNECIASNDVRKSKFLKNTCLDLEDFRKYLGNGENRFYGWHISDLKIYDEPQELSEFEGLRKTKFGYEPIEIKKPPQSWCFVGRADNALI